MIERYEFQFSNGIEVDERYFGPKGVRGKGGRGAGKKIIVFGLLKRHGKVFTQIIPNASHFQILPIIRLLYNLVLTSSLMFVVHMMPLPYMASTTKELSIIKMSLYVETDSHINGIESFWSIAKRRLAKFNGIPYKTIPRLFVRI